MKSNVILKLFITAVVLFAIFWTLSSSEKSSDNSNKASLTGDVNGQEVQKIKITQGTEIITLELKDGFWSIAEKNYYHADSGKVRSLLLGIFDLSVSQTIPATPDSYDALGLSDEAIKKGNARIELEDANAKILLGLRLGEGRKGKDKNLPLAISPGQYVKRDNDDKVFILEKPILMNQGVASWLDVNLLNVLPASVYSITQIENKNGSTTVLFDLQRSELVNKSGEVSFISKTPLPEGKELLKSSISDVSSALEDLTIADVLKSDDSKVKDIEFDRESIYRTTNGMVYVVYSAEKDSKNYIKIDIQNDENLVQNLKNEYAKIIAAQNATTLESSTTTISQVSTTEIARTTSTTTLAPILEPKYASSEGVANLKEKFLPWIFEVPTYKARRFRFDKTSLVEAQKPPVSQAN